MARNPRPVGKEPPGFNVVQWLASEQRVEMCPGNAIAAMHQPRVSKVLLAMLIAMQGLSIENHPSFWQQHLILIPQFIWGGRGRT